MAEVMLQTENIVRLVSQTNGFYLKVIVGDTGRPELYAGDLDDDDATAQWKITRQRNSLWISSRRFEHRFISIMNGNPVLVPMTYGGLKEEQNRFQVHENENFVQFESMNTEGRYLGVKEDGFVISVDAANPCSHFSIRHKNELQTGSIVNLKSQTSGHYLQAIHGKNSVCPELDARGVDEDDLNAQWEITYDGEDRLWISNRKFKHNFISITSRNPVLIKVPVDQKLADQNRFQMHEKENFIQFELMNMEGKYLGVKEDGSVISVDAANPLSHFSIRHKNELRTGSIVNLKSQTSGQYLQAIHGKNSKYPELDARGVDKDDLNAQWYIIYEGKDKLWISSKQFKSCFISIMNGNPVLRDTPRGEERANQNRFRIHENENFVNFESNTEGKYLGVKEDGAVTLVDGMDPCSHFSIRHKVILQTGNIVKLMSQTNGFYLKASNTSRPLLYAGVLDEDDADAQWKIIYEGKDRLWISSNQSQSYFISIMANPALIKVPDGQERADQNTFQIHEKENFIQFESMNNVGKYLGVKEDGSVISVDAANPCSHFSIRHKAK